jgi:hypothetical protein
VAEVSASVYIFFDKKEDEKRAESLYAALASAGFDRARSPGSASGVVVIAGPPRVMRLAGVRRLEDRGATFPLVVVRFGKAHEPELPPFLVSRPLVDLQEPDGMKRLVSFLEGAAPEPEPEIQLSPSMQEARRGAIERHGQNVQAADFAVEIARIHPEYAGGLARAMPDMVTRGMPAKPADDWLRDVRALVSVTAAPVLHGRAVMLCLGLLDQALRRQYQKEGLEDSLVAELREPLDDLLTERGFALWEEREPPPPEKAVPAHPEETVPTHTDNPATVDELGREGLARVLARRIRDMRAQEMAAAKAAGDRKHPRGRSFLVHVHAPWGMGKTSLLNFLQKELGPESGDPWVVIDFNAWRHQRIAPPWWWLMSALYAQGRRQLWAIHKPKAVAFVVREWIWRLWIGWARFFTLLAVVLGAVAVWWFGWIDELWGRDTESSTLTGVLLAVAAVAAPLLTLWAAVRGAGRWLLTTSPRGARAFVEQTRDPMATVQTHFAQLVRWLRYPLIVLVDDLDRCRGEYVVELLEGIQTLFRDQPLAYVVAADRDWLSDSYEAAYGDFVSANDEPGRPLGYLFLEKTFQMSVTLPPPSSTMHAGYWGRLLRPGETLDRGELTQAREAADVAFAELESEAAIRQELGRDPGASPAEQQARREAAAIQLASPAVAKEVQHALEPFAALLDANPRAMKRLVNAYGMVRGVQTLGGEMLDGGRDAQQTTALWTILALRWPRLADHLAARPEDVARVGGRGKLPDAVPEELRPLFRDPRVVDVVRGTGVDAKLDEDAVRRSAGQVQV